MNSSAAGTTGGGGASPQPDAGPDAGTGGAPAPPPPPPDAPDAGLEPVLTSIGILGGMVLDGESLVVESSDPTTHWGSLLRVDLGTWKVTPVFAGESGFYVFGNLLADAQRFYFFGGGSSTSPLTGIYAYPRAGGSLTLITPVGTLGAAGPMVEIGSSIAIDATRAYWTEQGADYTKDPSSIKAAPLTGGAATTVYTLTPPEVLAGSVAVDATSIYFTTINVSSYQSTAYVLPLTGTASPVAIWQSAALNDTLASISSDGTDSYVMSPGGHAVDCTPSDGQLVRILAGDYLQKTLSEMIAGPVTLTIAGGSAYYGAVSNCNGYISGSVGRVPTTVGMETTLATGRWGPVSIVINGSDVYWDASLYGDMTGAVDLPQPTSSAIFHVSQ